MREQETICVAYTGESVNDGTMDANELAAALLALSNLVSEANRTLNNDGSRIQVRVSSHFERGSFENALNLIRTLSQQIKLFFSESGYSLKDILNELGLASTLSGINLLELIRQLKGKQPQRIERIDDGKARVIFEEKRLEVSIGVIKLFKSEKIRKELEGTLRPLKNDGVDSVEFRDSDNKNVVSKINSDETEYFNGFSEELKEKTSSQELILKILNVNFERDLKWRFDDGESKFYAVVEDKKFLDAIEKGQISFSFGDTIIAEIKTTQQYVKNDLKKSVKTITKVLKVNNQGDEIKFDET